MGTMTKQTSTPGYYTIPELDKDALKYVAYPVYVTKLRSPQLVYLYAEDGHLQMSELAPGSVNFDNIKQFCMTSRQEEQLLYDFCYMQGVIVLCEVRSPEHNHVGQCVSQIRPLFVFPNDESPEVRMDDLASLSIIYWKFLGGLATCNDATTTRTISERISLSLAVDLARREKTSPGVLVVDSNGDMYRATNVEWQAWNKLLKDLSEDMREGRIRRLTYPRLDEVEEYYREHVVKILEEDRELHDGIYNGEKPLWALVREVGERYGDYRSHALTGAQ